MDIVEKQKLASERYKAQMRERYAQNKEVREAKSAQSKARYRANLVENREKARLAMQAKAAARTDEERRARNEKMRLVVMSEEAKEKQRGYQRACRERKKERLRLAATTETST